MQNNIAPPTFSPAEMLRKNYLKYAHIPVVFEYYDRLEKMYRF